MITGLRLLAPGAVQLPVRPLQVRAGPVGRW
jgi:hypothetical protein